jgi:hypothetical protein
MKFNKFIEKNINIYKTKKVRYKNILDVWI